MFGEVIKMFNDQNGIIKGSDDREYMFSKINYMKNFNLKEKDKVLFKPLSFYKLNKAIMILKK